jgi:hypothetical protein
MASPTPTARVRLRPRPSIDEANTVLNRIGALVQQVRSAAHGRLREIERGM